MVGRKQFADMNYEVKFKIQNNKRCELTGFEEVKTAGMFDPGWGINLLFHDIFEHREFCKEYSTKELSQAGECVAMGIRTYLYSCSGLVHHYAGYNKYQGIEWNTWNTILLQVAETKREEDGKYPNNFNYTHLKQWKKTNEFQGMCEAYNENYHVEELYEDIETAVSYGYWLGEHLFKDRIHLIGDFCENLKQFLIHTDMESRDPYDTHPLDIDQLSFNVKVGSKEIVGRFGNGIVVSDSKEYRKSVQQWERKFELAYL